MSQFKITEKFRLAIKESTPPDVFLAVTNKDTILRSELIELYEKYHPTKSLLALLRTTQYHLVNKNVTESKPKTKEYIQLMERLRLGEKESEYKALVNPKPEFDTLYEPTDEVISPAQMNKEMKNYITTIINILISVASVVYAIWYWTDTSWKLPDAYRVLMCLFFGLLVLVAEVVVYLGYLNKIDTARKTEQKKKEVKKIIKTL